LSAVAASIIATGCFWGTAEHHPIWTKALNRLVNPDQTGIGLQAYPAVLLQYAAGIGAAAAGKLQTIYAILTQPRIGQEAAEEYLPTELFNQVKPEWFKELPGLENVGLPRSEHLYQALRAPLRFLISSEREYMQAFDMFEMLQSLEAAERVQWAMPGAFMYRYYRMRGGKPILRQDGSPLLALKEQIRKLGEKGPVLAAGFLHGAIPNWEKAVQAVDEMSAHLS
jgi:hypothetical protein